MPSVSHDLFQPPPPRPPRDAGGISRRSLLGLRLGARARADIPYDEVTESVRAGWEREGHEPLLRALEPAAEVLVEVGGVGPEQQVLDAAAGDGNVAAAALARGAEEVDACDLARAMVERGGARVPDAYWTQGDVQDLPYGDAAFDVVLSGFGAVLAPRPRRTARELVRVVRPGGVVGFTAWVPRGLPGRFDELVEIERPLPEGIRSAADWGVQAVVRQRLEPLLEDLTIRTRTVPLALPDADALLAALARPTSLDAAARTAIRPAFDALLASCNNALGGAVQVDGRYLVVTGRRPAAG